MRKFILVTAMVLAATTAAQASQSRGLSLASVEQPGAVNQPATTGSTAPAATAQAAPVSAEPFGYVDRPVAVAPAPAPAPVATATPIAQAAPAEARPVPRLKPKKKVWTEQRIISELHRPGIYW